MSNTDLIIELLEKIHPGKYCDDCLSNEINIFPRQQVNQICRSLEKQSKLIRQTGLCLSCDKNKIVNLIQLNHSFEIKKISIQADDYLERKIPHDSQTQIIEHEVDIQFADDLGRCARFPYCGWTGAYPRCLASSWVRIRLV